MAGLRFRYLPGISCEQYDVDLHLLESLYG